MTTQVMYEYLGKNGTVCTPVYLEDIYYVRKIKLIADNGKALTNDNGKTLLGIVIVPEDEVDKWKEVKAKNK